MPLSLQEISDRLEIQDLLVRYAHCIDARDIDGLDDIFTPDARIDYTAVGGAAGGLAEIKDFLRESLALFSSSQHMIGNTMIDYDDPDTVRARTICHNPMVHRLTGEEKVMTVGIWYVDVLVRTPDVWRIKERVEEKCYIDGLPGA